LIGDGVCRLDNNGGRYPNCWAWPDDEEWVTLLFHINPGTYDGALGFGGGNNDTLYEVFAARYGETSYRRIWHQPGGVADFDIEYGWNALIASIYHNGASSDDMTAFYHRYCQMIFSKQIIACPQV
jgi:hypothetical protein